MSKKTYLSILLLAVGLLMIPLAGQALVVKSGDNVNVNEVIDGNFFAAGSIIAIDGTVNGDVFVAGNTIIVSGIVNGDVFAVGSNIDVSGIVTGNVRFIGSSLNVRGQVERNVMAAGSSLMISNGASVGRHLSFSGASLVINGPVGGQLDAAGASVSLNSKVAGNVMLELGSEGTVDLGDMAELQQNLTYRAAMGEQLTMSAGASVAGDTIFNEWQQPVEKFESQTVFKKVFAWGKIINFLSLFILGLILIYLMPQPLDKVYSQMKKKFWPSLGRGLVVLIVTPVLAIILLFTVIGIPLALIMLAIYGIALYLTKAVVALAVGRLLSDSFKWQLHPAWCLLIGLIIISALGWIPVIGWLLCFVLMLWALGAFYKTKTSYLKELR